MERKAIIRAGSILFLLKRVVPIVTFRQKTRVESRRLHDYIWFIYSVKLVHQMAR